MKLLCTKRSPYARKVRVTALEKGIALDLVEVDLAQKSAQLTQANPVGKIPALIMESGEALVDSPVICEYLDVLRPVPALIPPSGEERFRVLQWQALADGLMDVTVALYLERLRHPKDLNQTFIDSQEEAIARTLTFFDASTKAFSGLSLASIAVACAIGYLNFRLAGLNPEGKYPLLQSWYDQFSKRPSMAATIPVV